MQGKRIVITGKVQGVFFRQSTKEAADKLGVTGWVRNASDGSVEIVVFGDENLISQFINWCKQGPPQAEINEVNTVPLAFEEHEEFMIKN